MRLSITLLPEHYVVIIIVGFISTHSLDSGTLLLRKGWILFYSGVVQGERHWAGVREYVRP